MADKKISALNPSTTPLTGTEVLPIVQSGSTVKVSVADLTAGRTVSMSSLGVGTTTPATTLDVNGNATFGNGSGITIGNIQNNDGWFDFAGSANVNGAQMSHPGTVRFLTNSAERMRITSVGDVAIGTSTAGTKFHVVGGNVWSSNFFEVGRFQKASGTGVALGYDNSAYVATIGAYSHDGTASNLAFWTYPGSGSAAERMRIDSSGNVGIGAVPTGNLSLNNNANINFAGQVSYYDTNSAYSSGADRYIVSGQFAARYSQNTGSHRWYTAPSGTAGDAIGFTQAMTLDSSGNLLVGTTSTTLNGSGAYISNIGQGVFSTGSGGGFISFINNANTSIGSITNSANTAVLYNTTSDARLKHDIIDAPEASSLIDAIQVRSFKWNEDNSEQRYGFIAQELITIAPEAVSQPADPDDMMGVDYSKLVPMLVKEIQSLRARVAELEGN
jgi:hypothetical protein